MKTLNRLSLLGLSMLAMFSISSCNEDVTTPETPNPEGIMEFKEGYVITRELSYGDSVVLKIEDVITNFGTEEIPVLFPINKSIEGSEEWRNTTHVISREGLAHLIEVWANTHDMALESREDSMLVCHDIFAFFFTKKSDMGLFINLLRKGNSFERMKYIATTAADYNIPVDEALRIYSDNKETLETRGTAKNIIGIIGGIKDLYDVWNDFSKNSTPIAQAVNNVSSFISPQDEDYRNYKLGNKFSSSTYKLKYWVSKWWHSKFEFVVEGYVGTHPTIPGYFIPKSQIRTTYIDVKGPEFIGKGEYSYSPVINVSPSFDYPVVQANGQVKVTYGDCCCYRFVSYLNFALNGQTGYSVISYDNGK